MDGDKSGSDQGQHPPVPAVLPGVLFLLFPSPRRCPGLDPGPDPGKGQQDGAAPHPSPMLSSEQPLAAPAPAVLYALPN